MKNKKIIEYSNLMQEWVWEKNNQLNLIPENLSGGSNKKVWWKCAHGHEWQSAPHSRSAGHGCPCCSGRVPKTGINDLATVDPKLALQWHPTKNEDLLPSMFLPQSSKKVWWLCPQCGHEWQAVIGSRHNGRGCPNCRKIKLKNP